MSSPTPSPDRIRHLAEAGDWAEVHDLLSGADRRGLSEDRELAYLFGQSLYYTGRLDALDDFASRFEDAAREGADATATMWALNLRGNCAFEKGRTGTAEGCYEALMELAEAEGNDKMQADAANNLGAVAALRGKVRESLAFYRLAAPLYEKLGHARGLAQMHHNVAIAYRDMDRLDDAVEELRRATGLGERVGHEALVVLSILERAEIEMRRGDVSLARSFASRGLEGARELGDPMSEADGLRIRGILRAVEDGAREEALRDMGDALALAEDAGARYLQAEIHRDTGRILQDARRSDEAQRHLEAALSLFRALGAADDARQVEDALDGEGSSPS